MSSDERIASILGDWQSRRDRGEPVEPEQVIAEHPELAAALRERFSALGALKQAARGTPAAAGLVRLRTLPLERYRDFTKVGQGGMGIVYWALDTELNRIVAFKVVRPDAGSEDPAVTAAAAPLALVPPQADTPASQAFATLKARFLQEAWVTGGMEHPGIVPVYEVGETPEGVPYYTMRFVKGTRTLAQAIEESRAKPMEERLALLEPFLKVCDAVRYAHARGVIHRDLKPENVALGEFGEVVVLDWGLAKVKGDPEGAADPWAKRLEEYRQAADLETMAGALGTPGYMAPEAIQGQAPEVDERSDVYSLGAILFQILTGRLPFVRATWGQLALSVLKEDAPTVASVDGAVPAALSDLCARCLAREKAERPADAAALAHALRAWQAQSAADREAERVLHEGAAAVALAETLSGKERLRALDRAVTASETLLAHDGQHAGARELAERVAALRRRGEEERDRAQRRALARRTTLVGLTLAAATAVVVALLLEARRSETERARQGEARERQRADAEAAQARARAEAESRARLEAQRSLAQAYVQLSTTQLERREPRAAQVAALRSVVTAPSEPGLAAVDAAFQHRQAGVRTLSAPLHEVERLVVTRDGTLWCLSIAGLWEFDLATGRAGPGFHRMPGDWFGDGRGARGLALAPDMAHLWVASKQSTLGRWDLRSGASLGKWRTTAPWLRLAVTPDGGRLFAAGAQGALARLDPSTGAELLRRDLGRGAEVSRVVSLDLTPDGERMVLVSASEDGRNVRLTLLDAALVPQGEVTLGAEDAVAVTAAGDGRLYVASRSGAVSRWTPEGGLETVGRVEGPVRGLCGSPDGRLLAVAHAERGRIEWLSVDGGPVSGVCDELGRPADALAFTPDGRGLCAYGGGEGLTVLDLTSGRRSAAVAGHEERIRRLVRLPADGRFVTACEGGWLRVWSAEGAEPLATWAGPQGGARRMVAHPRLPRVVIEAEGVLAALDVDDGRVLWMQGTGGKEVAALELSADGAVVLAAHDGAPATGLWDAETGQPLRTWEAGFVAVDETRSWFAVRTEGRVEVRAFDREARLKTGFPCAAVGALRPAALSPEGAWLAATEKRSLLLFATSDGREQHLALPDPPGLVRFHYAPHGKGLLAATAKGVTAFSLPEGKPGQALAWPGDDTGLHQLLLEPGGRRLHAVVRGEGEGRLLIWEVGGGPFAAFGLQTGYGLGDVVMSGDGTRFTYVSGSLLMELDLRQTPCQVLGAASRYALTPDGRAACLLQAPPRDARGDVARLTVRDIETALPVARVDLRAEHLFGDAHPVAFAVGGDPLRVYRPRPPHLDEPPLQVWALQTGEELATLPLPDVPKAPRSSEPLYSGVLVSPDGRRLLVSHRVEPQQKRPQEPYGRHASLLLALPEGRLIATLPAGTPWCLSMDGTRAYLVAQDGHLRDYHLEDGRAGTYDLAPSGWTTDVALQHDGGVGVRVQGLSDDAWTESVERDLFGDGLSATDFGSAEVLLTDPTTGRIRSRWGEPSGAGRGLAFSPDGRLAFVGGSAGRDPVTGIPSLRRVVRVRSLEDGRELATMGGSGPFFLGGSGRRLVCRGPGGDVVAYDVAWLLASPELRLEEAERRTQLRAEGFRFRAGRGADLRPVGPAAPRRSAGSPWAVPPQPTGQARGRRLLRLTGTVLAASGEPAVDARVVLAFPTRPYGPGGMPARETRPPLSEVTSDAVGAFEFERVPVPEDREAFLVAFRAGADGPEHASALVRLAEDERVPRVTLRLASLERGAPPERRIVRLRTSEGPLDAPAVVHQLVAQEVESGLSTPEGGAVGCWNGMALLRSEAAPGHQVWLVVTPMPGPGQDPSLGQTLVGPIDVRLPLQEFTLSPPRTLTGRVQDEVGAPISQARVLARIDHPLARAMERRGDLERVIVHEARTDAEGGFRLTGLAPHVYVVRVEPPPKWRHPAAQRVEAGVGELSFVAATGRRVRVRALDGQGLPVEGARVSFGAHGSAPTDAEGWAESRALPPEVTAFDWLTVDPPDRDETSLPARLGRVPAEDRSVTLVRGRAVDVFVVDADGRPIRDGGCGATNYGGSFRDGRFRLRNHPTEPFDVFVHRSGGWPRRVTVAEGKTEVRVVLAGPTLSLRVLGWSEAVAGRADPLLAQVHSELPALMRQNVGTLRHVDEAGRLTFVDADDSTTYAFYAGPLPDGRIAYARGLKPGSTESVVTWSASQTMEFVVHAPEGATNRRVRVYIPGFVFEAAAQPDGSLRVAGMPPGTWRVQALALKDGRWLEAVADVPAGERTELTVK